MKHKVDNVLIDLKYLKNFYKAMDDGGNERGGEPDMDESANEVLTENANKRNALLSTLKTKIRRSKPLRAGSEKFIPSISIGEFGELIWSV